MTPDQFIYFLDGFLSVNSNLEYLNEAQTKIIKEKLSTVFNKVTPYQQGGIIPKNPNEQSILIPGFNHV